MSLGLAIVLVVASGYASVRLTARYLNYRPVRALYYLGALVHECSHALLCLATGARIGQFSAFSAQPHVTHGRPRLPLVGQTLISIAPIAGGLAFLFAVDHFLLGSRFFVPATADWSSALTEPFRLLGQLRPLQWQSWVMALLMLNAGAMLGPSVQDLKNMWPALIVLFFISSPFLANLGFSALSIILANIVIQICLIIVLKTVRAITR